MAVPGMDGDGGYEDDNALFEEDGVIEFGSVTPTHLRDLANAVQLGEFNGLRTSLGANLEVQDEDGAIPLHHTCAGGFVEIVQLLLNSVNDRDCVKRMLESVDSGGDTLLRHAARVEHAAVIRLLLASGASPTKENTYGKAPTELADSGTEARTSLEAASAHMAVGY